MFSGLFVVHASLKKKNKRPGNMLGKTSTEIQEYEIQILKVLTQILQLQIIRTQAIGHTQSVDTLKTLQALSAVHTELLDAKLGDSVTLTLKCVSACHLRAFMSSLNSLEVTLLEDLKQLPGCHGYDLTDCFMQIDISLDMYRECEDNLKESEYL